jgi:hypothetical protein
VNLNINRKNYFKGKDRWLEWTPEERNLSVEAGPTEWEVVNTVKPKPQTHDGEFSNYL